MKFLSIVLGQCRRLSAAFTRPVKRPGPVRTLTSEGDYAALFNANPEAMWVYDPVSLRFIIVNDAAIEKYGYSRDEFGKMTIMDIRPASEASRMHRHLADSPDQLRYSTALSHRRKDGAVFRVETYSTPVAFGRHPARLVLARDVSERILSEEVLRRSEERFRALIHHNADVMKVISPQGLIVDVNDSVRRILGYDVEELVGRPATEFIQPDDYHRAKQVFSDLRNGERSVATTEMRFRHKDGSWRWLESTGTSLLNVSSVGAILATSRDITERKAMEEALQRSEERYRRLFEDDVSAVIVATVDGMLVECNPAYVRMLGFASKQEALRTPVQLVFPSVDEFRRVLDTLAEKGRMEYFETDLCHTDGTCVHVVANLVGMFDDRGALTQVKGYLFDDTKRKELERRLRHMEKMESLGTLSAGIAHDFNNIMSIIWGHATSIVDESPAPPHVIASVDAIVKASRRGSEVVKQLLTFARQTESVKETVHINSIIREVTGLVAETFPKTVNVYTRLTEPLPRISGDSTQLYQVILNLCTNARDALSHEEGSIVLATDVASRDEMQQRCHVQDARKYVTVVVSDTGDGIEESIRDRIFDPFFTTKAKGKGTGLGLATVYGIVQRHRGFVHVESAAGEGTAFRLYFPAGEEDDSAPAVTAETPHVETAEKETILLVEDETLLRELYRKTLERHGFSVLLATDGREGIDLFKRHSRSISLVLSDIGLPRLSGTDMVREMKQLDAEVPILIASGFVDDQQRNELRRHRADKIIEKPFDPKQILVHIQEVLKNRRDIHSTRK